MKAKKVLYWVLLEAIVFVLLTALCSAQDAKPVYNPPGKLFGLHCKAQLFKDPCFWVTEASILATGVVSGFAESHAKAGGTYAFGRCGTCTSNGDIAMLEAAGASVATGLQVANHKILYSSVPLGKFWNVFAYTGVPAGYDSWLLYQASGNWSSSPAPKVDMSHVQIVRRP
jgi:hypothetical protein